MLSKSQHTHTQRGMEQQQQTGAEPSTLGSSTILKPSSACPAAAAESRAARSDASILDNTSDGNTSTAGGGHDDEAFVTMLINDDFAIGAEVMLHSLREHSRIRRAQVVIVTAEVSEAKRQSLSMVADKIIQVQTAMSLHAAAAFVCYPPYTGIRTESIVCLCVLRLYLNRSREQFCSSARGKLL